jgi:glycogen operon protein
LDGSKAEIAADRDDNDFFLMLNALDTDRAFAICAPPNGKSWYLALDTGQPSPEDFLIPGRERLLAEQNRYTAKSRSAVVLIGK